MTLQRLEMSKLLRHGISIVPGISDKPGTKRKHTAARLQALKAAPPFGARMSTKLPQVTFVTWATTISLLRPQPYLRN